jgi:hypothetical protein
MTVLHFFESVFSNAGGDTADEIKKKVIPFSLAKD